MTSAPTAPPSHELLIEGKLIPCAIDDDGKPWWSLSELVGAICASDINKTKAMGRVYAQRFKTNLRTCDTMEKYCSVMRMPGSRGLMSPAMNAEGLLELIAVMPVKRSNVIAAKRAKEAHDQLQAIVGE
jgi:hypothetical protein